MTLYKIGNFIPKNRIFLAPMLEPNDPAFRLLCHKNNCGLVYTGMFSPLTKQKIFLEEKPAIQLLCNSPKGIKNFIKKYDNKVSLWDLNLGCPSPLAKKHKFGVFLQDYPERVVEILKEIRKSTNKPITIKIRKSEKSKEIISIVEPYIDAISIHPRTKEQGYSGEPDIQFAESIKKMTSLPVIYSGNVNKDNASSLLKKFDFIMVGRESLGNPQIFSQILGRNIRKTNLFFEYLSLAQKYNLKFAQIKFQAMNFTKGIKNAKKARELLVYAKSIKDLEDLFKKFVK